MACLYILKLYNKRTNKTMKVVATTDDYFDMVADPSRAESFCLNCTQIIEEKNVLSLGLCCQEYEDHKNLADFDKALDLLEENNNSDVVLKIEQLKQSKVEFTILDDADFLLTSNGCTIPEDAVKATRVHNQETVERAYPLFENNENIEME